MGARRQETGLAERGRRDDIVMTFSGEAECQAMAAKNTLLSSDIFGGHSVGGVGGVANITANPLVAPQVGPGAHPWVAPQGGLGAALGGVGTSIGAVLAQGGGGTQFGGQGGELSAAWW